MSPLLLLGGTFDPVHRAHLAMAREALSLLGVDSLRLLPAGDPPHRPPPGAGAQHRLRMLRLACAGDPRLEVDERELHRQGPSYSVLTLREYRQELGAQRPLVMVLGSDAAGGLTLWHEAPALSTLCHLLVLVRPGERLDPSVPERLGWRRAETAAALRDAPAGRWYLHQGPLIDISSTAVRAALREQPERVGQMLPPGVVDYLREHRLYG